MSFDLKMSVKMNLRMITKNQAADPEIGFLIKWISKPFGRATAMPPAWELRKLFLSSLVNVILGENFRKRYSHRPSTSVSNILARQHGSQNVNYSTMKI